MPAIKFIDMRDREKSERARLETLKADLELRKKQNGGALPDDQERQLKDIKNQLKDNVVDPLYKALDSQLTRLNVKVDDHDEGKLRSQLAGAAPLTDDEIKLTAVFGLLQLDNADPSNLRRFPSAVTRALGEYSAATDLVAKENLFDRVLEELREDGDIVQDGELRASQVAAVFRTLFAEGVQPTDSLLPLKVRTTLARIGAGADGGANAIVEIDLPDLETEADRQIVSDNLKALQAIYFSAMLEEMRFFQAMDVALEQWQLGMIVLSRGAAGNKFYQYWRKTPDRFSELERRSLYSRAFGIPGGEAVQGSPNREFKDLWLRFLSAVSSVARQFQVDNLLRSNIPVSVSQELVRQTGRDLATNLSLHGYGMAYFAATELQTQINEIKDLLSDDEVKSAYGARDMFQVIEQIILLSGGGVVNSIQKRVSANAGSVIIRWLADHSEQLAGIGYGEILSIQAIRNPLPRTAGDKPTTKPTDADLVNAVEQWIAVNGIQDATIEQQAQAAEPPRITSRPIQVPDIARDLLGDLPIPMSANTGNGRQHAYR
jgi:hypothetical protein